MDLQQIEEERAFALDMLDEIQSQKRALIAAHKTSYGDHFQALSDPPRLERYLNLVQQQNLAEMQIAKLNEEGLKTRIRSMPERDPLNHDFKPFTDEYSWAEHRLKVGRDRMSAIATVSVFGAGIAFTTIFGATRGSVGLMAWAWTAFTISFSICTYLQLLLITGPIGTHFYVKSVVVRRTHLICSQLAGASLFVGILLLNIAIMQLDLRKPGTATTIDTTLNVWPGGLATSFVVCLAVPLTLYLIVRDRVPTYSRFARSFISL